MKHDDITPLEIQYRHSNETQNYIQINSQYWLALYFTRVGLRLRSASGGPESPDFCSVHAVNQGIDIPRSPKKYINCDLSHPIVRSYSVFSRQ